MDTRLHVRGRVTTNPYQIEGDTRSRVTFLLENQQPSRPASASQQPFVLEEWCEVICEGELAENALRYLAEGDHISVWGELRVARTNQEADSVLLSLLADTVGHDLCFEPKRAQLLASAI